MPRSILLGLAGLLALLPATAQADCQLSKYFEIPITMIAQRPTVTAQINGRDARFILDSGAFFSTIAKADALEYGLTTRDTSARLRGLGGETSLGIATAKEFRIAGQAIPHLDFVVGGSDTGFVGLLGQNILGFADAEFDLSHGTFLAMTSHGCSNANMAYWAGAKPSTMLAIEPMGPRQRHIIATIKVNGVKVKALFDTGAGRSMLTLSAAKRIGVAPGDSGVVPADFAYGLGQKRVPTWRAKFDTIDIGGEAIPHPTLMIADQLFDNADMLIGIDFFLTHRVFVDNQHHQMFITYEGGPLFGLDPKRALDGSGAVIDLTDHAGEPTDAVGLARRGALRAADGRFDSAITDFDRAVALAPTDAHILFQRAAAHLANRQMLLGAADLDRAIELAPGDADPRMARAAIRLQSRDPVGALTDLQAADGALSASGAARLRLASMYSAADSFDAAIASYNRWLASHAEDAGRAIAFNGRCWARAMLDRDLDKALGDCDAALRLRPNEAAFLDSRGLVRLRRGELAKAMIDYNNAVAAAPRSAWTLFARGVVEQRLGDTAQAGADRAAAVAIDPRVEDRAKRFHVAA
jgi:tetratricopeptide (TPR) repeat protein